MRYPSLSILLLGTLAACDSDLVAPEPPAVVRTADVPTAEIQAAEVPADQGDAAIQDVMDRIVPSLESQPGANGLRTALEKVDGPALERILLRLESDSENAADVSVIRLALGWR